MYNIKYEISTSCKKSFCKFTFSNKLYIVIFHIEKRNKFKDFFFSSSCIPAMNKEKANKNYL